MSNIVGCSFPRVDALLKLQDQKIVEAVQLAQEISKNSRPNKGQISYFKQESL